MSLIAIARKITALEKAMRAAAEAEDFELARSLRDEIANLKGQAPRTSDTDTKTDMPIARQPPPGQMGLGTHIPVAAPPKGWKAPKKPDPMTSNTKSRRRR